MSTRKSHQLLVMSALVCLVAWTAFNWANRDADREWKAHRRERDPQKRWLCCSYLLSCFRGRRRLAYGDAGPWVGVTRRASATAVAWWITAVAVAVAISRRLVAIPRISIAWRVVPTDWAHNRQAYT